MTILKRSAASILFALLFLGFSLTPALAQPSEEKTARESVKISETQNIRAVYHATEDTWSEGIGKTLFRLKNFLRLYRDQGVKQENLDLHAVYHGDAGYWMLTDEAYNEFKDTQRGNPNKEIIQELVEAGVSIELCSQTMKQKNWSEEDILPSVVIVHDAYSRLVDLQLRDYAYIRF